MAKSAAESSAPILITGESGVGKDLVARYIHRQSSRRLAPFVAVNCAGLTEARLESELFGHVHGHMADVLPEKRGKLRLAHRGTLFLDQVGDMILRMQAWLLRFLENGEIQAVGSERIAGACRRSRGRRDQSQSERPRRRGPVPRGPPVPAARHPPPRAAPSGAGRRHSRADAALSARSWAGAAASRTMRFARCCNTNGQETSGSSGTSSNSSSGCRRATLSGSSTFPSRCCQPWPSRWHATSSHRSRSRTSTRLTQRLAPSLTDSSYDDSSSRVA